MNDKQIIKKLFERDDSALKETAHKYGRLCYKIAYEILRNPQDAEECVSTAYVKLWNSIPPKDPESLCGYLCAIVRNTALSTYRTLRVGMVDCYDEIAEITADSMTLDKAIDSRELSGAINSFLAAQNKTNCGIFVARYYFNMSVETISGELGMNSNSVYIRLTRLRRELRKYLEERGIIV